MDFLKELEGLLRKHNTSIVRSANSSNDLVVVITGYDNDEEYIFAEEISEMYIRNEWFTRV